MHSADNMPAKRSKKLIFLAMAAMAVIFGLAFGYSMLNRPDQQNEVSDTSQNRIDPPTLPTPNDNGQGPQEKIEMPEIPSPAPKGEISRGNSAKKQIIFTFDGGSGTNSAQKILEVTKAHGVKTTFFVTGKFAEKNPDLIKQIAQESHEIFNHTYSHPHLTQITDEQIKEEFAKVEQIVSSLTGKTTKPFFRPPYGDRNKHVSEVAQKEGYQSVFWTFDALDWVPEKTAQDVKQRIYGKLSNGAIILMHIGDDITGQILDEVFTKIENDGYKIVSLTEGIK